MADDTYDELYGDLYGDPEPTPAPVAPTKAPVEAAPAPAAPAAATYASTPAAPSVYDTNPAQQQQPPALHFDAGYSQRAADANKTLNVRPSDMPEEGKMFIGGLNWDTTDDSLRTYFEQFGAITHSTIMRDPESQRSRGFAFLTFESASSVNAVMASEHYLDGKTIDPKRAIPRADGAKTDKLFVRSIPNSCTQESFRAFWRTFGNITDATLMMDKESGRHRGFGFVNYEDLESVEKVLRSQPHVMDGQTLEVKRAQAKGENMRQNNNNQNNNQSYQPQSNNYNNNNNNYSNNNQGGGGGGGGPNQFDPAAMAKFFQQMGWGSWNPMMLQSMGGMPGMGGGGGGMPGMGMMGMPGMGMGMPGMGMGGMGYQGMGMGMGGMGMDPSAYGGGGGEMGGSAIPGGTETSMGPGVSAWTAPMAQSGGMRGGRGGGRGGRGGGGGGRGGFEYQGGAGGQGGMRDGQGDGASGGPTRSRGGGAGYHPYAR